MTCGIRFRFTVFLSNRGANAKKRQSLDRRFAVTRCDLSDRAEDFLRRLNEPLGARRIIANARNGLSVNVIGTEK